MNRFHLSRENILEAHQLRHGFLPRRFHHFVWRTLGHNASRVQHNHTLTQRKHFFPAVRHIEDGNAMSLVPLAQIVNDHRLGRRIERGQRLVQQQHRGIGHQRSRQSRALALSTRNLPRIAPRQVSNAERLKNR